MERITTVAIQFEFGFDKIHNSLPILHRVGINVTIYLRLRAISNTRSHKFNRLPNWCLSVLVVVVVVAVDLYWVSFDPSQC